jgi:hypothetical protein
MNAVTQLPCGTDRRSRPAQLADGGPLNIQLERSSFDQCVIVTPAKVELSVLSAQCLDCRIPDKPTLIESVAAWQHSRNTDHAKADWQFTTADARVKLKRLYPAI